MVNISSSIIGSNQKLLSIFRGLSAADIAMVNISKDAIFPCAKASGLSASFSSAFLKSHAIFRNIS
jgi:hypothetical protein